MPLLPSPRRGSVQAADPDLPIVWLPLVDYPSTETRTGEDRPMTTTEVVCCPMCRHAGDDGRPHVRQTLDNTMRCGRCEWTFVVEPDGVTRHWLNPYAVRAKRRKARRRRHRRS